MKRAMILFAVSLVLTILLGMSSSLFLCIMLLLDAILGFALLSFSITPAHLHLANADKDH